MTGNKDYLIKHMPDIKRIIRQIDRYVDEEGQMHFDYYFVDWPTHGKPDEYAGVRAVNIMAAKRAVSAAEELKEEFPEARVLLGKLLKKEMRAESAKQIIALKYFAAGELREEEKRALIKGGDKGLSTFMSYFILTAVSQLFGAERAEKLMKDYYGKMLSCGATAFWEDFDTEWVKEDSTVEYCDREEDDIHGNNGKFCYKGYRHSLCHGWASGPTAWLSRHVLGIRILEPGCRTISVEPHLGGLQWVEGSFPTPYGTVSVRHEKDASGRVHTWVDAPDRIKIIKR